MNRREAAAQVAVWAHDMLEINGVKRLARDGPTRVVFEHDGHLLVLSVTGVRRGRR